MNINSKDLSKIFFQFIKSNIKLLVVILIILLVMFQYLNTNIILILSFVLTFIIFYKDIITTFTDFSSRDDQTERIIENNKRKKKEIHFDEEINTLLSKFKKYRKYNNNAYDEGFKYLKMFLFIIHDLEKDNISHPKQYFENAELYLSKSINSFQSISISTPEEEYSETLKYNNFEPSKLGNRIGKLCKKLYKHFYYLLYNLSMRFNEDWRKSPDIYKSEIIFNYENVKSNNEMGNHWELY